MLTFRLLGQVALYNDDEPLNQFRSQKEAALLIYLAHTGQSHPRDTIAELLWEDRSVQQMRSNLRTALARLRPQVGDALIATRTSLALAPDCLGSVDSVQLLRDLTAFGPVDSPAQAAALQSILDAYTGDFLADFALSDAPLFSTWTITTREEIRRQVIAAYHKLGAFALNAGEPALGIRSARSWLRVDSLNEDAHALLIRLLLAQGQRSEAVAHYEQCVALLREDLDVAPSPELTALVRSALPAPALPAYRPQPVRHNLPPVYDQFFGRVRVQQEIHSRLDQPWCRLVTIVGQGGVGKTRLATTVAHSRLDRYADGVWLVELAEVDPSDDDADEAIATEIATAIDLRLTGSARPTEQLLDHLEHKQLLLVLDNFEHLLNGVQLILDLIQHCETVQLLTTSREALRIRAEWSIDLAGLDYPTSGADASESEALDLFLARRAQQQRQPITPDNLAAARVICRIVEGLPLAIELAAALTRDRSSLAIAGELSQDFDRLAASLRDVPERHSSLQVVFEMSWRTLSGELRSRLARLALFRGGFTQTSARWVADADERHLIALHEKSLLTFDPATERYALHSVVRAYAAAKRPPDDPAPHRHADYFLSLLAEHAEPLQGAAPQDCMAVISPDLDNVRLAWQTALAAGAVHMLAPALPALSTVYQLRGLAREAEEVMQATHHAATEWGEAGERLAVRAGLEWVRFQNRLGRYRPALETAQHALALAKRAGDVWAEGMGHILWGESLWRLGEYDAAQQKLNHALLIAQVMSRDAADAKHTTLLVGWSHHHLGVIDDIQGRYPSALKHLGQACDAWRGIGYLQALGNSLNSVGIVYFHQGNLSAAQEAMEQALHFSNQTDNHFLRSLLLNNLSLISTERGNYAEAQNYLLAGLELAASSGNLTSQGEIHSNLGMNYRLLGEMERASESLEQAIRIAKLLGNLPLLAEAMLNLAETQRGKADHNEAAALYGQIQTIARQAELPFIECSALIGLAEILRESNTEEAREYGAQAVALATTLQNPQLLQRAQAILEAV